MKIKKQILMTILLVVSLLCIGCTKTEEPAYLEFIYNTNGGEIIENTSHEYGTNVSLPTPVKEGYIFDGWYLDEALTDGPYESIKVEQAVILYASWEIDIEYFNQIEEAKGNALNVKILELPSEITLNDEKIVIELNNEYIALSDYAKTYVTNYNILEQAVARIKELKKYQDNETIINRVINAINDIPTELTLEDEAKVNRAKTFYDRLSDDLKVWVNNYNVLEQALIRIEELKLEKIDEEKVNKVINAIASIPIELTLQDESKIYDAITLYDELSEELKARVTNYQLIDEALQKLEELKQIISYEKIVKIQNAINTLPYIVNYADKERLENIQNDYNSLDEFDQSQIVNYDSLAEALNKIEEIENDVSNITYVLGSDIFNSREELYQSFFGDFYYFIKNNKGEQLLLDNNINDVKTFLEIGSDYDYGRGQMRGLGDIFGSYLLQKDVNGIIENQPIDKFLGSCYANNRYTELIPFFIRFFAYWRIDEGYANSNNYGADLFAESWAPTVDICKFFYFNEETSYVKSERMIDCFVNCANVVYGDLPTDINTVTTLPTELRLRGYRFAGWYDNKEFNGDPITTISNKDEKVILYAKWEEDSETKDLDNAKLVDVYINNLTTTKAIVNKQTVTYVLQMYSSLSANSKNMVENYNTLVQFESEVADELISPLKVSFIISGLESKDFITLKNEFLNDFNSVTSNNVTDYNAFINSRYQMMKHLSTFYTNPSMRAKWGFLPTYFANVNTSGGLTIQSNRVLNNQNGDAEYLSKAIGYFFLQTDATGDAEVNINFANQEVINEIISNQNKFVVEYTKVKNLDNVSIDGYTLDGYYDSLTNGTKYTFITDDTPTTLYVILLKK